MVRLRPFLLASALLGVASVSAQTGEGNDGDKVRVWAAVAYINHGEKTPSLGHLREVLTPEGAQQMWRQGRAFRARYINATEHLDVTEREVTGTAPIHGIDANVIDNTHVDVVTTEDEWVVGSALAFFQGLYPPVTNNYNKLGGGEDLAHSLYGNDSETVEFPLSGYQYPKLQTLPSRDSQSASIQGTVGCTAWSREMDGPLKKREDMRTLEKNTQKFYQDLFSSTPLEGAIDSNTANIWNAYELYEYVKYMHTHNKTVHNGLKDADGILSKLEENALALQQARNIKSDTDHNETVAELYTTAGRTLAARIADQLERNLKWEGARGKMGVMFGSFEPLLAFLSVGDLLTRENLLSGSFTRFPEPGAALIYELIGDIPEDVDAVPDPDDLRIRFQYRASADEDESFESFSLFGSEESGKSMPYRSFNKEMRKAGLSSEEWCDICGPTNVSWCPSSDSSDDSGDEGGSGILRSKSRLHPAFAGLIGALIMGTVLTFVAITLCAVCGFRIRRVSPAERGVSTHGGSSGGGFKGREKRAQDADVAVSGAGTHQERVGSWEMRGDDDGGGGGGIVSTMGLGLRNEYDTDGSGVTATAPVRPRESV